MTSYTLCLYAQCVMVQSPIAEDYVLLLMFNYHFFITKNPQLVGGFNPSETHRCQLKFYHPISRVEPLVTSPVYSYVSCFFSPASLLFMFLGFTCFCFFSAPLFSLLLCFCAFQLLLFYFFSSVMRFCCSTSCSSASLLPVFTASLYCFFV